MKHLPVNLKASERICNFIRKHEAFRAKAYKDQAGHWTIGYGHLILKSEKHLLTASLTVAEAEAIFQQDIAKAEAGMKKLFHAPMTQNQYDALLSLMFNTGVTNLKGSGLVTKVNSQASADFIGRSFLAWNKTRIDGQLQVSNGLDKRRKAEWAIFLS